jgi:CheY-like chemotaxis protein
LLLFDAHGKVADEIILPSWKLPALLDCRLLLEDGLALLANQTESRVGDVKGQGFVTQENVQHLLLLDDEDSQVWLLTRILKRMGYEVSGFSEAEKALESFEKDTSSFDAVISDLTMPGISGFDFAKAILQMRPDTPVILTTGYVRDEDQVLAEQIGVCQIILKGESINELGATLRGILGGLSGPEVK